MKDPPTSVSWPVEEGALYTLLMTGRFTQCSLTLVIFNLLNTIYLTSPPDMFDILAITYWLITKAAESIATL